MKIHDSESCISCLCKLVIRAGQCQECGAPPVKLFDSLDALPLQFLTWASDSMNLEGIICGAINGDIRINFEPGLLEHSLFGDLPGLERRTMKVYSSLHDELTGKTPSLAKTIGLKVDDDEDKFTKVENQLKQIRQLILNPIRIGIENMVSELSPLDTEFAIIFQYIFLKEEVSNHYRRLKMFECFKQIISADGRSKYQNHLQDWHKVAVADAAKGNLAVTLESLRRHAFFSQIKTLATTMLFLWTGEEPSLYVKQVDSLQLGTFSAPELGFNISLCDAFFLENIVQSMSWRSFRLDTDQHKSRPMRQRLHRDCLRLSLTPLAGQSPALDPWIALAIIENSELPPNEQLQALETACLVDEHIRLTRELLTRPFSKENVKNLIQTNSEFQCLGWLVGFKDLAISLPYLNAPTLTFRTIDANMDATFKALIKCKSDRQVRFSPEGLKAVRLHSLERARSLEDWEENIMPASISDTLLNLLILHEPDHSTVIECLQYLTAPAQTFWLRSEIILDEAIARMITGPDEAWGFRFETFCAEIEDSPSIDHIVKLKVDRNFIDIVADYVLSSTKATTNRSFQQILGYLGKTGLLHRSVEVLDIAFAHILGQFARPGCKLDIDDILKNLRHVYDIRQKIIPPTSYMMEEILPISGTWQQGGLKLLTGLIHLREDKMKLYLPFLESVGLISALSETMTTTAFCDFTSEIMVHPDMNDSHLFELLLKSFEAKVANLIEEKWISRIKSRLNQNLFDTNVEIETLIKDFFGRH